MEFNEFKLQLIDSMLLIKSRIQKILDPIAKSENLTTIQLYVLFNLYNGNINTIGGLSKDFGVNQGNISTLCKELEKLGMVSRVRNSDDERIVNIVLTPKGKEVTKRLDGQIDNLKADFQNVSHERIETVVKGIKEFSELLNDIERNNK